MPRTEKQKANCLAKLSAISDHRSLNWMWSAFGESQFGRDLHTAVGVIKQARMYPDLAARLESLCCEALEREGKKVTPDHYLHMGEHRYKTASGRDTVVGQCIEKIGFGIIGTWIDESGCGLEHVRKIVAGLNEINGTHEGPKPFSMSRDQLVSFAIRMQNILYHEDGAFNPDKAWDSATMEQIQQAIADFGLLPK